MNYIKNERQQKINYKHIIVITFSVVLLLCNLSTINAVDIPKINEITGDKDVINVINRTNDIKNGVNDINDDNDDILQTTEDSDDNNEDAINDDDVLQITEDSDDNNEGNSINFFPCFYKHKPYAVKTENPPIKLEVENDIIFVMATNNYGTPLPSKAIIVTVGDKTFSGDTDEKGIFTVNYKNADKYSISATFAGNGENPGYSVRYTPNTGKSKGIYASNTGKSNGNYASNSDKRSVNSTSKIKTDIQNLNTSANMENTGIAIIEMFLSILCVLGLSIRKE